MKFCMDCSKEKLNNMGKYCLDCGDKRRTANNSKQTLKRYYRKKNDKTR